ncbi:hypothetical protein FHX37_1569 [Haloactinospora alba]|uniref:Uncharacterized protein n=1 Tax=Haloactinospora alba TaxID=405555 RepID=A0A543NII7_9ACTN|nr:hypothetical protein FHX37_1569 [Haloactinospora alba]
MCFCFKTLFNYVSNAMKQMKVGTYGEVPTPCPQARAGRMKRMRQRWEGTGLEWEKKETP